MQNAGRPTVNTTTLDENLVARVVGAVMRELGYGAPLPRPEPELLPDAEIRRMFFSCSRSKYWTLTKTPPTGHEAP
jgi:hypothetical protein